jgi:Tsi6
VLKSFLQEAWRSQRQTIMFNVFKKTSEAKLTLSRLLAENPQHALWVSISAQLDFILQDFDNHGTWLKSAPVARVSDLIMGVQAIREIEVCYPELADKLCKIDYDYKKLYGLQN